MNRKWKAVRHAPLAAGVLLVVAGPGMAWGQSTGDCLTVQVPAPLVLPDGSTHEAGSLKICFSKNFSPAFGLHETYVNGIKVAQFRSRKGRSEGEAGRPYALFQKNGDGDLALLAYAWPSGNAMATYQLAEPTLHLESVVERKADRRSFLVAELRNDDSVVLLSGSVD